MDREKNMILQRLQQQLYERAKDASVVELSRNLEREVHNVANANYLHDLNDPLVSHYVESMLLPARTIPLVIDAHTFPDSMTLSEYSGLDTSHDGDERALAQDLSYSLALAYELLDIPVENLVPSSSRLSQPHYSPALRN